MSPANQSQSLLADKLNLIRQAHVHQLQQNPNLNNNLDSIMDIDLKILSDNEEIQYFKVNS